MIVQMKCIIMNLNFLTTPIVNFNGAYVHHPKIKTSKLAMKF